MSRTLGLCSASMVLVLGIITSACAADADDAQQREAAAARLFELPLYRELATREV